MTEDEQLRALCERLGSTPAQAVTMAAQLQKRATQLAVERGITREAALAHLLNLVVKGRSGEVPPGFSPPSAPPPT
jgi:predicted ArsR family transcriptional regulator